MKTWAKTPAKTSQKRGPEVFLQQVTDHLHETATVCKAQQAMKFEGKMNSISHLNDTNSDEESSSSDLSDNVEHPITSELVGNPKF